MNDKLLNKRILFLCPNFFGYGEEIKKNLEKKGATVDLFFEKPIYKIFILNYLFTFKYTRSFFQNYFLNKLIKKIGNNYDYVFIIRGEIITKSFLLLLRNKNPMAKFIFYQWDSVKNNNYMNIYKLFDKVMTFDMFDAKKLNIEYLPLFFTEKYEKLVINNNREFDLVFFGSYHGDRLEIIRKISNELSLLDLKSYIYVYIPFLVFIKNLLLNKIYFSDLKFLKFRKVSSSTIIKFYQKTITVLDIENPNQNGFTMRTFEVLGSGIKLITTNKNIFYNNDFDKEDVYLINRDKITLDCNFFNKNKLISTKYSKFSLRNWIDKVFYD